MSNYIPLLHPVLNPKPYFYCKVRSDFDPANVDIYDFTSYLDNMKRHRLLKFPSEVESISTLHTATVMAADGLATQIRTKYRGPGQKG